MIVFRHTDRRFPFLWEGPEQPAARCHGEGDGPVQYFADTPDGAWAEFLRHEEIATSEDVATIRRALCDRRAGETRVGPFISAWPERHSKDRDEVYRKAVELRPRRFAILYTGQIPKDTAIVL